MPLHPGARLGPYVIADRIGAGGMGEVFKAQDTRLNRFVAIKVIAAERQDAEAARLRFAAEARAIAALNHPHICSLFDTGFEEGRPYLVMEHLEGESLADRLARGPLPLRDLLGVAIEVAEALAYAHRNGIVHRDLKPANVYLARSGGAKLLDFGLAAMRGASNTGLAQLATQPVRITEEGTIPGTLHYLAPERLDGRAADARSDIYALAAMLHEMLSGRRPFDAPTQARLISAILTEEPAPFEIPPGTPAELQTLIQVGLCRNPDDRWQSAADLARMLKGIASRLGRQADGLWPGRRPGRTRLVAAGVGVLLLATYAAFALAGRREATAPALAFLVPPPAHGAMGLTSSTLSTAQFAVAPDNHGLVFVASAQNGKDALWIRTFDNATPRLLDNTVGASYPFWSADSKHIAFFADQQLKRIPASGGPPEALCNVTNGRGGTWNKDDVIVFAPDNQAPLHRISATGGAPTPMTRLDGGQDGHRWPQFLPDGQHLIFLVKSSKGEPGIEGIYVTSLDAPADARRLRAALTSARYAAGYLLYVSEGVLSAQRFDERSLNLSGASVPLHIPVSTTSTHYSAFSVADGGALATWSTGDALSELTWHDRHGRVQGTVASPAPYIDFRLSPDDSQLAVAIVDADSKAAELWTINLATGVPERLTTNKAGDATPVWSPDGTRLVFRSNRRGSYELWERVTRPGAEDSPLFGPGGGLYPSDWSRDGRSILYHERRPATRHDILVLDRATRKSRPLLEGPSEESQGQLSLDGRLAYTSDVSGDYNVYVGEVARPGGKRVSVQGGWDPRWRADGQELYFIDASGMLNAIDVAKGDFRPMPLFPTRTTTLASPFLSQYVPSRDGKRFLVKVPLERLDSRPIAVTMNWRHVIPSTK